MALAKAVCFKAYAKINLTLEVLKRLPDGYHEMKSVMQQVALHDEIWISPREDRKISLHCDQADLPSDSTNLVWKAVDLVMRETGCSQGVDIQIIKRIPIAGGMAGGSSDAAATIKGLNHLWNLDLSLHQMMAMGEKLGMDIPYCLVGGTAVVSGKGNIVTPLPSLPERKVVLANPGFKVLTKEAYGLLDQTLDWNDRNDWHTSNFVNALESGETNDLQPYCYNDFQIPILHKFPLIQKMLEKMMSFGPEAALLSGSGPSVYCIVKTQEEADLIGASLQEFADFVTVTSTIGASLSTTEEMD